MKKEAVMTIKLKMPEEGYLDLAFRSNFKKKIEAGLLKNFHELKNEVENNHN